MVSVKCYKQSDCRVRERCVQLNRVKAVEKEKDDLETVNNEAVEYLQMENDIVTKKNVLFQKYMSVFSWLAQSFVTCISLFIICTCVQ